MTRSKTRLLKSFGINKEPYITIPINMGADCVAYLNSTAPNAPNGPNVETPPEPDESAQPAEPAEPLDGPALPAPVEAVDHSKKLKERRTSIAGGSLFSIHGNVVETGADYFLKIPRATGATSATIEPIERAVLPPPKRNESNESEQLVPLESRFPDAHHAHGPTAIVEIVVVANPANEPNATNDTNGSISNERNETPKQSAPSSSASSNGPDGSNVAAVATKSRKNDQPAAVTAVPMILNNFDPFRRLPDIPFAIQGRRRRNSMFELYKPSLDPITE